MRVLVLIFCLVINNSLSNSAAVSFSQLNDKAISSMAVTEDEVFVAGENMIYKLSANLAQLMNVAVSNDADVSVRGLSVSNGGQYIVACLTTGSCIGYDVINLTSTMSSVPLNQRGLTPLTGEEPVVMFPGSVDGIVYTGTATDFQEGYLMSLGRYSVSSGSIVADTTRDYTLRRTNENFNSRIFNGGFNVDDFAYYIVEDNGAVIRILRVCNESTSPNFQALYEVELTCGPAALFASASVLVSLNTLVLTVRSPDTESVQSRSGRVCTYNINDINTAMGNGLTECINAANDDAIRSIRPIWDTSIPSGGFNIPGFCNASFDVSHNCIVICI